MLSPFVFVLSIPENFCLHCRDKNNYGILFFLIQCPLNDNYGLVLMGFLPAGQGGSHTNHNMCNIASTWASSYQPIIWSCGWMAMLDPTSTMGNMLICRNVPIISFFIYWPWQKTQFSALQTPSSSLILGYRLCHQTLAKCIQQYQHGATKISKIYLCRELR
jgi:hypothetical protein